MTEHAVAIVGAGPTGLMLAGELALADVDVVILERRPNQDVDGSRARGLHSRTIEVLDQRGIADRFLDEGQVMQVFNFAGIRLNISDFPTRHNYGLALWQRRFEPILANWVEDFGVPILRGREVIGVAQDGDGVTVTTSSQTLRAQYLVGCDGGRSTVRKAAGIDFPGLEPSTRWMIAEVDMRDEPEIGMLPGGGGIGPVDLTESGGPYRVVLKAPPDDGRADLTLNDIREGLVASYGTDFGVHGLQWISRFSDATRQAGCYRCDRILLAGDAAHVHHPQGGQGLNIGVQDAVNLGWKLSQVVNGTSPDILLDTYHAERHPVGARVLQNTMAQVALGIPDARHQALRDIVTELLGMDEPHRRVTAMVSGLDIQYDLGGEHPLVGRRIPDLDLKSPAGPTRMFDLLNEARPLLISFGEVADFDTRDWEPRLRTFNADCASSWDLPVIGEVRAPPAVLVRPDGHVAWAGDLQDPELPRALTTWFGTTGQRAQLAR